ncbi:MAG: hypothetical protein MK052_01790 [Alphaproteobacteria bacterium]|nr:hypothetical protein [Alphaproteobacteria bacterium]
MRQDEEFTPLQIVKKNLSDFNRCAYRVYKTPKEFVTVEAATALEAFRESGIKNPLRIIRETRFMDRLVDQARFTEMEEVINTGLIMEAPAAITGHTEAVPQAEPSEGELPPAKEVDAATASDSVAEGVDEIAPESAQSAEPEHVEDAELSEDDVQALLADDEAAPEDSAAAEDDLSPDDVAKLLGEENND